MIAQSNFWGAVDGESAEHAEAIAKRSQRFQHGRQHIREAPDVAFYNPYKADGYDKALGIRRVETLAELLATSQVVSRHCPLTAETRAGAAVDVPERAA